MKRICLCFCLCILLLAFAGCGEAAPVSSEEMTEETTGVTTEEITEETTEVTTEVTTVETTVETIPTVSEVTDAPEAVELRFSNDYVFRYDPSTSLGEISSPSDNTVSVQFPKANFVAWTERANENYFYGLTDDFRLFYMPCDGRGPLSKWDPPMMDEYGECRVYRYMWPMCRLDGFAAVFKGDTCILFDYFNLLDCRETVFRLGSTVYNAAAEPIVEAADISITSDEYILYRQENETVYHLTNAAGESLYTSPADVRALCIAYEYVLCEKDGTYFMADRYGKAVADFGALDDASMQFCNLREDYDSQEHPRYCFRFCSATDENELYLTYVPATGETGTLQ